MSLSLSLSLLRRVRGSRIGGVIMALNYFRWLLNDAVVTIDGSVTSGIM